MNQMHKEIEKSARRVFKIFFGSRLYLRRKKELIDDIMGVALFMNCDGEKRVSFYMGREIVSSLIERFASERNASEENIAYDIIGEMANMITGNAVSKYDDIEISVPMKFRAKQYDDNCLMNFSSKVGRFAISVEDM